MAQAPGVAAESPKDSWHLQPLCSWCACALGVLMMSRGDEVAKGRCPGRRDLVWPPMDSHGQTVLIRVLDEDANGSSALAACGQRNCLSPAASARVLAREPDNMCLRFKCVTPTLTPNGQATARAPTSMLRRFGWADQLARRFLSEMILSCGFGKFEICCAIRRTTGDDDSREHGGDEEAGAPGHVCIMSVRSM